MSLTVTVSQLNRYVKAMLEEDRKLSGLLVRGEISGFTRHYKSGHCYFRLKDENANVSAVMFRSYADDLRFAPEDGMAVIVQGNVSLYERDGAYQLYVTDIQPDGVGVLAVAMEQLKRKLSVEGLFDSQHKQPLPEYPSRIGVVTSETGAALRDIQQVLSRRYPVAKLVLCPALVQGRDAPKSLIRALQMLDSEGNCDVILLARGGGSAEDLNAFNDEALARAVFAAKTPVISAVGHETDFTICDFVADLRAPTPSAAAELASPSREQLERQLVSAKLFLQNDVRLRLRSAEEWLMRTSSRPVLHDPTEFLAKKTEKLDFLSNLLYNKSTLFFQIQRDRLAAKAKLLDSLSPLRVLERGYCLAYQKKKALLSAKDIQLGQPMTVCFHDGVVQAVAGQMEETE